MPAVSARKATDSTRCFPEMVDASNDYFPLSDDSHWTDDNAKTSFACSEACRLSSLCVMYRFTNGQDSPQCHCYCWNLNLAARLWVSKLIKAPITRFIRCQTR
jgi:hypothetical protein